MTRRKSGSTTLDALFAEISANSVPEVAELLKVNKTNISNAGTILVEGTKAEINEVESGESAISTVAKKVRDRRPKSKKKSQGDVARSETHRMYGILWKHLRSALDHLTSLPLPADVIPAVKSGNKGELLEAKLTSALNWLKEFEHEWNKRGQT